MALRILVVEDDFLIAMDLATLVEELGHQVCGQAEDADGALELAARHRPDLVLMDVRLANGDNGVDAAAEIYRRHGIRSLFVSGNIDASLIDRTRPLDPVGFVSKPTDLAKLRRALGGTASVDGEGGAA